MRAHALSGPSGHGKAVDVVESSDRASRGVRTPRVTVS